MKTIAIDFDGVIHKYSGGWKDGSIYDEPIEGAFEFIKQLMEDGYSVFIFSARNSRQIKKWLDKYLWHYDCMFGDYEDKFYYYGYKAEIIHFWTKFWNKPNVLGITNRKLPALAYIDDRAICFKGNWKLMKSQIKKMDLIL